MALSKQPYKGTRDLFPQLKREQDYLFSKMRRVAAQFGFEPYDGPLLEEVELYKAKSGQELINDQIYSFSDRGERFVAIRPEMTPTLARMIAQIHREYPKPIRWYAIPNLMRYERPQKGRLREHWQFNCDIFGAPEGLGELEIFQVAITLLESFGANSNHFEILYNDRIIVDTIFKDIMKLDHDTCYQLYKIVDRAKKINNETLEKLLSELKLSRDSINIFQAYLKLQDINDVIQLLKQYNLGAKIASLQKILDHAKSLEIDQYLKYDPTIVRGLDYYTGLVFEIFDKNPENRRAICGGGAYADLLKIFNEGPLPGIGFGLGDVTLIDFLKVHGLMPDFSQGEIDIFLAFQDAKAQTKIFKLAKILRQKGLAVLTQLEAIKINKIFPLAQKRGALFTGLVGEDELTDNKIQIKNLMTKKQQSFCLETEVDQIVKYCQTRN